jgi:hypothetical protein
MTRNDFYLGLGFIGMILSFGFHAVNYSCWQFWLTFEIFFREELILSKFFLISLFIFIFNLIKLKFITWEKISKSLKAVVAFYSDAYNKKDG